MRAAGLSRSPLRLTTLALLLHQWGIIDEAELLELAPPLAEPKMRERAHKRMLAVIGPAWAWGVMVASEWNNPRVEAPRPECYDRLARALRRAEGLVTLNSERRKQLLADHSVGEVLLFVGRLLLMADDLLLWVGGHAEAGWPTHSRLQSEAWAPLQRLRELTHEATEAAHMAQTQLDEAQLGADIDPIPF